MLEFFVPGVPAPGGSKRGFVNQHTGRVNMVDTCKRNKSWRSVVALMASQAMNGRKLFEGPLSVEFRFFVPRPKGHYGTGRNAGKLKPSAPTYPTVKPDVTKLVRSSEDALKGITWKDDNQIVWQVATKHYGERPGLKMLIREI